MDEKEILEMNAFVIENYDKKSCSCSTNGSKQPVNPKGLRWCFGDPKKRKRLVRRFVKTTSLHGVKYICCCHKIKGINKYFYRILLVFCFAMLMCNEIGLLQDALGKESTYINSIIKDTSSGFKEDKEYFPMYPAITLCRKPPYRTDFNRSYLELVEYVFLALGFPMVSFTPHELSMVVELDMYSNDQKLEKPGNKTLEFGSRLLKLEKQFQKLQSSDSFNLTHFIIDHSIRCHEFFSKCIALVFSLHCCDIFQPVLTTIGLCYTMKPNHELIYLMRQIPLQIPFIIDLLSPPHPGKSLERGFDVFLTDPRELISFFHESEGQKIAPGYTTTISADLFKRQRTALYTSWHGKSTYCPKLLGKERFTHKMCTAVYSSTDFSNKCNCTTILQNKRALQVTNFPPEFIQNRSNQKNQTKKICGPYEIYGCFFSNSLKSNLSFLLENCQEPCIYYGYHSKISSMRLGGENISRLQIIYNPNQYLYLEYRKTTLSSLFSQIGGALGLYLGASIITVVEVITFVASWMWFKIYPQRLRSEQA